MAKYYMTTERKERIRKTVDKYGIDEAAKKLGVSKESLRRDYRYVKNGDKKKPVDEELSVLLRQIGEKFNSTELAAIAKGALPKSEPEHGEHDFSGKIVKIGLLGDTHIGSKYFQDARLRDVFREFKKAKVDLVAHTGDVTEGMSHRPGHVYELTHLGYNEQKKHAIKVLSEWTATPMYFIDGNHDRWFIKSNGAHIVSDICEAIPNAHWLGHDIGTITLAPGVEMMLWHGEDGGGSYALSYRLQKIVESLKGGQKPAILAAGHDHKAGTFFIRNIHCIAGGCIQQQSAWMRGKRMAAHEGFHILTVTIGDGQVKRFSSELFPYYD